MKKRNGRQSILVLGLLGVIAGCLVYLLKDVERDTTSVKTVSEIDRPYTLNTNSLKEATPKHTLTSKEIKPEIEQAEIEQNLKKDSELPEAKNTDELDHSVCKKLGYCIHKDENDELEDASQFKKEVTGISDINALKRVIKPLHEEKKFEEVLSYLNSYNGSEQNQVNELREVLELQIFATNKIAEARKPLSTLSKNPKKEFVIDHAAIAREEERRTARKTPRELEVHNDIVGIGMDKLIVFNDRGVVIKYSKLIRACENKASKFFDERRQKAITFLEENKNSISIIPHNRQKVNIRQGGGLFCQVYYGTSTTDEYGYKTSRRNIGYILTLDLKPLPVRMVSC